MKKVLGTCNRMATRRDPVVGYNKEVTWRITDRRGNFKLVVRAHIGVGKLEAHERLGAIPKLWEVYSVAHPSLAAANNCDEKFSVNTWVCWCSLRIILPALSFN
jgi:hypothetical protein